MCDTHPTPTRFGIDYNSAEGFVITDSDDRCATLRCGSLQCATRTCDALNLVVAEVLMWHLRDGEVREVAQ